MGVMFLQNALSSGMLNGHNLKGWLVRLLAESTRDHPKTEHLTSCHVPGDHAGTTTLVEHLFGTENAEKAGSDICGSPACDLELRSIGSSKAKQLRSDGHTRSRALLLDA